jgi:hypothetical protein
MNVKLTEDATNMLALSSLSVFRMKNEPMVCYMYEVPLVQ